MNDFADRSQPSLYVSSDHYDRTTIMLHWLTVLLVTALWTVGQTADWLPKGPFRAGVWASHVLTGFVLICVIATRIAWRASNGRALPAADSGALHVVAKGTHYLLYVLLVVTACFGVANAVGHGVDMYGLWRFPKLEDKPTADLISQGHEYLANSVVIVALLHASAALVHHYLWHDGVLRRMWPGLRVPTS